MSIRIKDETANALVLTIDNNGNMAFADGTPINMLTLGGYGIIDSEGYIVHGLGFGTAVPQSGTVSVPLNSSASVATIAGTTPIVQIDTSAPAIHTRSVLDAGTVPYEVGDPNNGPAAYASPYVGGFTVQNRNSADETLTDPSSPNYDSVLSQPMTVPYRWM
jgi:hypothetical protein